jgi:hypothetical protein
MPKSFENAVAAVPSRYAAARLTPGLRLLPSGFLYNPRNAESYSLNPVGACLIEALQSGTPPDEIWQALPPRFAVSEPLAHRDALLFLSTLAELRLLTMPQQESEEAESSDSGEEKAAHGH